MSPSNDLQIAQVKLQSGLGHVTGHTVQQNTSKSTKIAITVCPDPRPGFHVHINLVSFPKKQHYPVGAVVSDVGGSWMFRGADNSLTVLVQEQKARVFSVSVGIESEVVNAADWSCEDS